MKSKFMIVAACIATLTAVPASAQLLGGGGGGGLLGGSIGGVGGSLGGTLGGSGSGGIGLDRSIDLDNGRVGANGSGNGRADGNASGSLTRRDKSRSGSATRWVPAMRAMPWAMCVIGPPMASGQYGIVRTVPSVQPRTGLDRPLARFVIGQDRPLAAQPAL